MVANLKLPKDQNPPNIFFLENLSVAKLSKYFCQLEDTLLLLLLFLVLQQ